MLNPKVSLIIIIFQSILFILAGYIQDKLIDRKTIKLVRVGPCLRTNLPHQFFVRIGKSNLQTVFISNATAIVREDLKDKLKITVSFRRCASRENLDSCEDYYKMRNLDLCKAISAEDIFPGTINPFSIPYQPKMRCPMKQGAYQAINFTFNFAPFLMFDIEGWYWRILFEVNSPRENNRPIGCTNIELYTKL